MPTSAPNLDDLYDEAGYKYNVDPLRIKAHAIQETGERARVASGDGKSWGFGQFTPETWARVMPGVPLSARGDPATAIEAMSKFIAQNDAAHTDANGNTDVRASTAAYNGSGPAADDYAERVRAIHARLVKGGGLKTTGAGPGKDAPAANDDDAFGQTLKASPAPAAPDKAVPDKAAADDAFGQTLKGGPAQPAEAQPSTAPSGEMTAVDDLGRPIPQVGADTVPIPEPVKRIGQAAADAWNAPNPLMTPELQRMIEGGSGPGHYVGNYVTSPLLQLGGWGLRGAGALTAGGLAAANELVGGGPLGRDVAQMLQLMPEVQRMGGLAGQTALPQAGPRNALAPGVDRPYLTPEASADIAASRPNLLAADANETSPTAVPTFSGGPQLSVTPPARPQPGMAGPSPGMEAPQPRAVGAEATSEPIPPLTPAQKASDLQKMIGQSAEDRLTPQGRDDNVYFPGVARPEAMKDFTPASEGEMSTALQHKTLYNTDSHYHDRHDAQIKANNAVMTDGTTLPDGTRIDGLKDMFGDANTRDKAMDHARELMPGSVDLFKDEKPVDVQPIADKIKEILASGAGKTDAVANTLKGILPKLYDAAGKPETMPSIIKGIFDDINNKLYDKSPTTEGNAARISANQLKDVKAVVSDVIGKGLPGTKWKDYLTNLSGALGEVNKLDYMQRFLSGPKGLWGSDGMLKFNKVKNMLQDILDHHADQTGGARQMTMEEINKIEAVRNELAAKDLLDRRADVRGSPTVQLGTGAGILGSGPLGTAVKTIAEGGAHLALAPLTAGVGNVGLLAAKGWAAGRKAKAAQKEANALAATKNRLLDTTPNPLAGP